MRADRFEKFPTKKPVGILSLNRGILERHFIASAEDFTIRIFNIDEPDPINTISSLWLWVFKALQIDRDNLYLASAEGSIWKWSLSGEKKIRIKGPIKGHVFDIAIQHEHLYACGSSGTVV